MSEKQDTFMFKLDDGEKLYKFWFFRPAAGKDINFQYRIMTKEKVNGLLDLVSYNFKIVGGIPQKNSITHAEDITKDKIQDIVQNVMISTKTTAEEFEELDLTHFDNINEQINFLVERDRVTKEYIT
jgi:hypothetical protein